MSLFSFALLAALAAAPQSPTEEAKLVSANPSFYTLFGSAVSIEGDTAAVGEPGAGSAPPVVLGDGAVHVFVRSGTSWAWQDHLLASDAQTDYEFGEAVALSGDLLAVGAPGSLSNNYYAVRTGAVYLFTRSGTTWSEVAKLLPQELSTTGFGRSVALEGNTLLVGARTGARPGEGAAYVFAREGATWTQQARLVAGGGEVTDVALSGSHALVGATNGYLFGWPPSPPGSAHLFQRRGTDWPEVATFTSNDVQPGDLFGAAVAIDGGQAMVGAPHDVHAPSTPGGPTGRGSVYSFERSANGAWVQQQKLTAGDAIDGLWFGVSIALEGEHALIGQADSSLVTYFVDEGAAHLFRRSGSSWRKLRRIQAIGGSSDDFGYAVDFSGNTALVGARYDNENVLGAGAAYVFRTGAP